MKDLDTVQPDIRSWKVPSLAVVRDTVLGAADFTVYYPFKMQRSEIRDGKIVPIPTDAWRTRRMDEQFDAVLYLGPRSSITQSQLSPALCTDQAYMTMRLGRIAAEGPPFEAERLKNYCAGVVAK